MKHKWMKRYCILFMLLAILFSVTVPTQVQAAKTAINKKKVSICVGSTYQLKVKNAKRVTWSSTNKRIVSVTSKGKITGRKSGTATIKAKAGSKTYSCKVTVKKVSLSAKSLTIAYGKQAILTLKNAPKSAAWFSSNPKVAYISNKQVTARSVGTAIITAKYYGKSYTCTVTVTSGEDVTLQENGLYTSKDMVAVYIHTYHKLPSNFITNEEAKILGWHGGSLLSFKPYGCIGGDNFGNSDNKLPKADGRKYYECDIDTLGALSRGGKRLVYSNDGLIFYTDNHYDTFTQLY